MIYVLIGTRAQLIKMAPVMIELKKRGVPYTYVSTAQHADTMDELHEDFGIRAPDFYLAELNERKTVFGLVYWFFKILLTALFRRPKWFSSKGIGLIHGDTLSTLLGAILLKLTGNQVAHVESGLRSYNIFNPFPEELIRVVTFSLTDIYFCPDKLALANLKRYSGTKINTHGNTLIDAVRVATKSKKNAIRSSPYCIFSFHRYENLRSHARRLFTIEMIKDCARTKNTLVVMHPLTEQVLRSSGQLEELQQTPNVSLIPRMKFTDFIKTLEAAEFIVSDGGSNQEEASYLGVPCGILRTHTERSEGLTQNSVLICFDKDVAHHFLDSNQALRKTQIMPDISPSKTVVDPLLLG
jgi:UDP-N-acetylglucosamine 2-epimerase (non-hydrolysing)